MKKKDKKNSSATPNNEPPKRKRPSPKKADGSARKKLANPPPLDLPLADKWYQYQDLMMLLDVKRNVLTGYIRSGILISHKWGGTRRINKAYVDWMIKNGQKLYSFLIPVFMVGSDALVGI